MRNLIRLLPLLLLVDAGAAERSTDAVLHYNEDQLLQMLKAAGPGIETAAVAQFPNGSLTHVRRAAGGQAEVHRDMADVWFVMSGSAVVITGGTVEAPKEASDGETRGPAINGGVARSVSKGDVVTIPAGIPHWVKQVTKAPLVYAVVKVSSARPNK